MNFEADRLADYFTRALDFMLAGYFWSEAKNNNIKGNIESYKKLRDEFTTTADPEDALQLIVRTKVTNAFYRELSDEKKSNFESDFNSLLAVFRQENRSRRAIDKLTRILTAYSVFQIGESGAKDWVKKLFSFPTLKEFTESLSLLRKKGEKSEILGDKGADHYLRGVGHWDIVPIDIHEKRFLIRTGIFHTFGSEKKDPLENRSLQDSLIRFCSLNLQGKTIEGINLGSAPGIVDLFIWSYCSDQRYNICGKIPKCQECSLTGACFLSIANTKQASGHGLGLSGARKIEKKVADTSLTEDSAQVESLIRLEDIKAVKKKLATKYIRDPREKNYFLKSNDKDIHDWGVYVAGIALGANNDSFTRKEIIAFLKKELDNFYDIRYARESRILPADNCWNCVETSKDNKFPCMEAIDKSGGAYSYRFLGFGKALEKKMNVFKTEVLKNALKNYQGG